MDSTAIRRVTGLGLLALGIALAAGGAYHLYCRFVSDEAWWDTTTVTEQQVIDLEETNARAREQAARTEGVVIQSRKAVEELRRAGKEDEAKRAEDTIKPLEANVQELKRQATEIDGRLASARAAIEERKGRWLRRGILFTLVGLSLSVRGWLRLSKKPSTAKSGPSAGGGPTEGG